MKKWKADENLLIWKPLVYDAPAAIVMTGSPTTNCIDEGEEQDNSNRDDSSAESSNIDCDANSGVEDNADLEVGIKEDDDEDDFFETSTPLVKKVVRGSNEKEEEEAEDDDLAKERVCYLHCFYIW